MALLALGWGRLLAAPTGRTKIEGPVTEGVLQGEQPLTKCPDTYFLA
jgi:hypothetical protein